MKNEQKNTWLVQLLMKPLWLILAISVCLVVAAFVVHDCWGERKQLLELEVESNKAIDLTPQQIRSIERIGQWEFLAIDDEELVDTVRHRMLGPDDKLARIYHGTLRLGLDLSRCREGWIVASGDTVRLVVPPIQLLSHNFIDEARTVAFYESGTWSARDKEAMYKRAARRMRARSLTKDNYHRAEANATEQLTTLMRSFGFRVVEIEFEE